MAGFSGTQGTRRTKGYVTDTYKPRGSGTAGHPNDGEKLQRGMEKFHDGVTGGTGKSGVRRQLSFAV
jgi:hypothetical protein